MSGRAPDDAGTNRKTRATTGADLQADSGKEPETGSETDTETALDSPRGRRSLTGGKGGGRKAAKKMRQPTPEVVQVQPIASPARMKKRHWGLVASFVLLVLMPLAAAIFYLVMDIAIHWGVLRHLREDTGARAWVLVSAIILDLLVLGAFAVIKFQQDPMIIWVSVSGIIAMFGFEIFYLKRVMRSKQAAQRENTDRSSN